MAGHARSDLRALAVRQVVRHAGGAEGVVADVRPDAAY